MVDFLVTFLEESSTPPNGIIEISQVILPIDVLDNIVNIMDRFYNDMKDEKSLNDEGDILNNSNMINKNDSINSTFNEKVIVPQNTLGKKKINDDILFNMENLSLYQNKFINFSSKKNNNSTNEQNNQTNININNNNMNAPIQE